MPNPADAKSVLCSKRYRTSPNVNPNPITLWIISVLTYETLTTVLTNKFMRLPCRTNIIRYLNDTSINGESEGTNHLRIILFCWLQRSTVYSLYFSDTTTSRLRRHNLGRQEQLSTNELSSNTGKQSRQTNTRCSSTLLGDWRSETN